MPAVHRPLSIHRRAFSAIELLVVLGIIVILLSIFIPYILRKREDNYRLRCDDNLRKLGAAFTDYAYAGKGGGDYPRVVSDPTSPGYTCFTGPNSPDPFAKNSAVRANDVTASLWLLVRLKLAEPTDFICPSTDDTADWFDDDARLHKSNFSAPENLSYSYASPFSSAPGYRLNKDTLPSGFQVMADKNPGIVPNESDVTRTPANSPPLKMAMANSKNHGQAGQHVLYVDGHVDFQTTPYCGVNHDNIYTAQASAPIDASQKTLSDVNGVIGSNIGPATPADTYLVPTALDQPSGPAPVVTTMPATTQSTPTTAPTTRPAPPATTQSTQPTPSTQPATPPATSPTSQPTTQPSSRPA